MTKLITQAHETNKYFKKDHWYYLEVNNENIAIVGVDLTFWFGSGNEPKDVNDERIKKYTSYKSYEESDELL